MAESLLSTNLDTIFMVLSLLPTESLLRLKSVCRAWAQVISDPAFARAHSSRPTPITAFFTLRYRGPENQIQGFKPFQEGAQFPSCVISGILSSGFRAVSRDHGLICFHRDLTFLVGNPATSRWSVVRYPTPSLPYKYHGVGLIYDPAISLHFKLAVGLVRLDGGEAGKHYLKFSVYSSETSSWTVSSEFTQWQDRGPNVFRLDLGIIGTREFLTCKVGGGSICWTDEFGFVVGYEICSDTYWKTKTPKQQASNYHKLSCLCTLSYDGIIYHIKMCDGGVGKVWRLEGKDNWVFEGEGSGEELCKFPPQPFQYDRARRALLVGGRKNGEYFALHLSSSRLEFLSQGTVYLWDEFDQPRVAHGNTLAPIHGAQSGIDGLAREFSRAGLHPLDL